VVLLACVLPCRADTVELKTGEHIEGAFRQAGAGGVVIEAGGQTITIPLVKVRAIYFGAAKVESAADDRSPSQEALDAVRALRSVTQSGISYRDYAKRALDAKVKVDRYLSFSSLNGVESQKPLNQTSNDTQFYTAIKLAMFLYEHASGTWSDWLSADDSARAIQQPKLGTIEQRLDKLWKNAATQVETAERLLAKH